MCRSRVNPRSGGGRITSHVGTPPPPPAPLQRVESHRSLDPLPNPPPFRVRECTELGARMAAPPRSRSGLARTMNAVLERGQLLEADRAAGMKASGCNADLGAKAKLPAIRKLR